MKASVGRRIRLLETQIPGGADLPAIVFVGLATTDCLRADFKDRSGVRSQGEAVAEFQARVMKDRDQREGPQPSGGMAFGPLFS